MVVHACADVKRCDPNRARVGKAQAEERIENRERLNRLWRVEIVAILLVCDVETRSDDRNAPHWGERRNGGVSLLQPLLDGEIHADRGVGRQSSISI